MIEHASTETLRDGSGDFDFLIGRWNVHHRYLRGRLDGSTTWDQADGTSVCRTVLNGAGNMDELSWAMPDGWRSGMTLRLYDPATRQWGLYWASDRGANAGPIIPVVGRFAEGGRGEFFGPEDYQGTTVLARFIWTVLGESACRWEQAYSADDGATWETNWTMDFTRAQA